MTPDPNRPEALLSVPNEIEAAALVSALAEYGIEAFAAGGYTSGFKAEAPGNVTVLVKHVDMDRTQQALAEIRAEQGAIDWSKVDGIETPESPLLADESASADADWRPVTNHLWWIMELLGVAICFVIWLFTRNIQVLAYAIVAVVLIGLVLGLSRYATRRH